MAIVYGRGGAPGSYIYEGAIASQAGRASFNTVYMMVEAPEESSILTFPFNRPIAISSLNEYENLIGALPTTAGGALTSYYSVKAFFQQAPVADLRVTRVGTPSVIKEVSFNPAANKDNGFDAPSSIVKGDIFYIRLAINGIELGDRTPNGVWLGVPVVAPVSYIAGDLDNNVALSVAMRDAVSAAIRANADISAGAYIREEGLGDPACDECAYLFLTGRVFNAPIEVIENLEIVGNNFTLASSGYTIKGVTESDVTVYDWVQCARTAFDDPKLSQGYMIAPGAFAQYNQADRVNLGQTMEEVCSDANHKWLAMVDCGPYTVTDIVDYKDMKEHVAADGFKEGDKALIENVIYEWVDLNALAFTPAKYDENSAARSANPNLAAGDRRSLADDRIIAVNQIVDVGSDALTLSTDWPANVLTGERIEIELATNDPKPTAPAYSDAESGAVNEDLVGTFYVIAADVDSSLDANQIKLATSRTRALGNQAVDVVTAGTPQGGVLLAGQYYTSSWGFDVTIKGKTSNVIEVNNSNGASVNTKHLPGSLQQATAKYDFQGLVRQITDPSASIGVGGVNTKYVGSAAINTTANTLTIASHGFSTRDRVYVQQLPSATKFAVTALGPVTGLDTGSANQDPGDATDGTYSGVAGTGGGGEDLIADIVISSGSVASATIVDGGRNYAVGDLITFAKADVGSGSTNLILAVATIDAAPTSATRYVIKVDDNTIQLATSDSLAEAGTAENFSDTGTDSASIKAPNGAPAQAIISSGGDALFFAADHGLKTAERIYFDAAIETANTTLVKATTSTSATSYYVRVVDRNLFMLTPSASNLAAEVFMNFPTEALTTATPVRFYRALGQTLSGGTFSDSGIMRFTRGRKYQLDATLAVFRVKDEAGVGIQTGVNNPYGVAYTDDLSTDLRLSGTTVPTAVAEYDVAAAGVTNASDSIGITAHGFAVGSMVRVHEATSATLPDGLAEDTDYFVIVVDADNIKLAATAADAVAGTAVALADDGVDNTAGACFVVTEASNPYTFTYTEDEDSNPLNFARDFAGDNNFYCVPLSDGEQADPLTTKVYAHLALETATATTALFSAQTEVEFVEPQTEIPNSLWNFNAVTSGDLIAEALRGVNSNGVPQAKVIETGMDNHNRLFSESQKYSTTQGFLAYYAPYIKNDVGVFVPPTGFVSGLAMRRYRDEIAGFRLPPAGAKYSLAGARGCQVEITTGMQDVSNPYGLNALRQLPGYSEVDPDTGEVYGPVFTWGARTRINPANAEQALYKFVNTRVIMNVIYGTLDGALDGQIFNIIDGRAVTFNQIRTLVSNILYSDFFVPGCLFGATANEAFDVIVDDRNNPAAALENGLVNVQVFVVPVPTLERIEIDLLRVNIGGIPDAKTYLNLN